MLVQAERSAAGAEAGAPDGRGRRLRVADHEVSQGLCGAKLGLFTGTFATHRSLDSGTDDLLRRVRLAVALDAR